MRAPTVPQARARIQGLLSEWLGNPDLRLTSTRGAVGVDFTLSWRGQTLAIQYKPAADAASAKSGLARLVESVRRAGKRTIPILAVPYMGEVGQRPCDEAGVGWLDLSGNASIRAAGLVINVKGRENLFKRRGRPASAFAPKAARVARQLLIHPDESLVQRDLAELAELGPGYTSKVVRRLEAEGLLVRDDEGRVRTSDPALLLDAWSQDYDFDKHRIVRGYIAARNADRLAESIAGALRKADLQHAATGLTGAWLLTRFAAHRLATFYLDDAGLQLLEDQSGFREEARGANVWLVVPNDDGVYQGAERRGNVTCAHPAQVYLDLLAHPERAKDAAQELRKRLFSGEWT
jgi:hypothetical protein